MKANSLYRHACEGVAGRHNNASARNQENENEPVQAFENIWDSVVLTQTNEVELWASERRPGKGPLPTAVSKQEKSNGKPGSRDVVQWPLDGYFLAINSVLSLHRRLEPAQARYIRQHPHAKASGV